MTTHLKHLVTTLAVTAALAPSLLHAADLPPTLTGTLINAPGDTLTFGTPSTTTSTALANNSALINNGTWNAHAGTISPTYIYNSPTFDYAITNTGTLNIDAGAGTFALLDFTTTYPSYPFPVTFANTGTINLNSGNFYLAASDTGSTSGTINLAANTTLGLAGTLTFDQNSAITGAGNVLLSIDIRNDVHGFYVPNVTNTPPAITFNGTYNSTGTTTIFGTSVTFNHDATFNNLQVKTNSQSLDPTSIAGTGTLTLTGSGTLFMRGDLVDWTGGPTIPGSLYLNTTISVKAITVQGTLKLDGASKRLTIDGTAITVDPGARLALGTNSSGDFSTIYFSNNASITNNGTIMGNSILFHIGSAPSLVFTNNGFIQVRNLNMGFNIEFNNNGIVDVMPLQLFQPGPGTDSKTSVINVMVGAKLAPAHSRTFGGTLNNAGWLHFVNVTLSKDLTFNHIGVLQAASGKVLIAARQQSLTTGTFTVDNGAILEFAADYDFSSPTGPSLLHSIYQSADDDGLLIIDPNTTLTIPLDTAFAGTIQVDGTLIIAPPLNPANLNMTPNFTILPTQVPEPATLALLTLAIPLLLRKRA
jgi:hypothetical protein